MGTKIVDNERKACDATVQALEQLQDAVRSGGFSPEDEKKGPPVEYVFDLKQTRYAIEHTVIEAFDGQLHADIDFQKLIDPIIEALDTKLPKPGVFHVAFEIHPTKGKNAKSLAKTQAAIIAWIRETAALLHSEHPKQPAKSQSIKGCRSNRSKTIDGVDIVLTRETGWFVSEGTQGRLLPGRFAPPDREPLRRNRVATAIDNKSAKLHAWKSTGARSVLVLENRDLALSNHLLIGNAVEDALRGRQDAPDEVWLVDTTIASEWTAWCIARDGMIFPDGETSHPHWTFDPATLCDL